VTDLRPYQPNRLALDPRTLPAEVDAPIVQLDARPYRGGGVVSRSRSVAASTAKPI